MLATTSPFSFVLFGASGNLAKLKIYPALYVLALKKRLPPNYAVVGYARTDMTQDAFRDLVSQSIHDQMPEVTKPALEEFLTHLHYVSGQYDSAEDFGRLATELQTLEKGWGEGVVRLAYLSVPPAVIPAVLDNLCSAQVHRKGRAFRCIVEKPIGHDSASFEKIRMQLMECFSEEEIFLLDHYLGKEAVRNVYYLRYANPIVERLFTKAMVRHVEVTASESLGIEERAGYFEHTGTFRDMVQSHLLMMVSLLTMHVKTKEEEIRESRLAALRQLVLPKTKHMDDIVIQGQYAAGTVEKKPVIPYLEEQGVAKDSRTNTYVALKLHSKEERWDGVPFYLRSGKRLSKKETRIGVLFQEPHAVGAGSTPNRLDIILQGEAGMKLYLQTKLGGTEPAFRPLIMEDPLVCMGDCLPEHALLILEAIHGKQVWFLTFEEARTAWKLVDPLQEYLEKKDTPLYTYAAGTDGPEEAERWIERDGVYWF